jgi:hypothetical protein
MSDRVEVQTIENREIVTVFVFERVCAQLSFSVCMSYMHTHAVESREITQENLTAHTISSPPTWTV